jgi:hypothetical protein
MHVVIIGHGARSLSVPNEGGACAAGPAAGQAQARCRRAAPPLLFEQAQLRRSWQRKARSDLERSRNHDRKGAMAGASWDSARPLDPIAGADSGLRARHSER